MFIRIVILVFVLFFFSLMVKLTIPYFSFKSDVNFLLTKPKVIHNIYWKIAFYFHITFSLFVLLFGALQFIEKIPLKTTKFHKLFGKIYLYLVLIICAPSGLVLAIYANGGIFSKLSFMITSLLWWIFTYVAIIKIKKQNYNQHRNYMIRSYSLTLSAISLRLLVLILPYFLHLRGKEMYTFVAWMSWIPNLIIAEFIIKRQRNSIKF